MTTRRDRYLDFAALARHSQNQGAVDLLLALRPSPLAVLAPHGGGIEPGTSELAHATAGEEYSLYTLEGLHDTGNSALHITSTRFDDPACLALLKLSQTALVFHGCEGSTGQAHVGGLDNPLIGLLIAALNAAGFPAVRDNTHHSGADPRNLCNRGLSGKGAQLEIDLALRASLFAALDRPGRRRPTPAFHQFVSAVRSALKE